tara:strand:- start:216 stop:398 length:183 start_codon:yes stop_codon:yes gene_type:complete
MSEQKVNWEGLYQQAQQDLANSMHQNRMLVLEINKLAKKDADAPLTGEVVEAKAGSKKPN